MNKTQDRIWFLIVILSAVALTIYTLSDVVTQPWHAMPGNGSDGVRSEYGYLYHAIYEKGLWFNAMNYPYGDHIMYADGQVFLFLLLSCFKHVTVGGALTLLWWLIGLSYVLCIAYLYKTLIHFGVGRGAAVFFACLIGIFTPQVSRFSGHFGLSYTCVIPMLFYWTIRFQESSKIKYCIYIFILGLIATLLHPYFSAMMLMWAFAYSTGYLIFTKKSLAQKLRHIWALPVAAAMIFVVVGIMLHFTDPVKDRPVGPYGFLVYNTHINDIFTSPASPLWQYASDHHMLRDIFPYISEGGEGVCYPGIVAIIAIICSLFIYVVQKIRHADTGVFGSSRMFSPVWMFAALLMLLFSMGVPFIWHMEWLIDHISYLRQFRSIGRFSWVFYNVASIYGAILTYRFFTYLKSKRLAAVGYAVLTLSVLIWSYEASSGIESARKTAKEATGNYDYFFSVSEPGWETFLKENNRSRNDFQAILALPFFHVGSDKLWIGSIGINLVLVCKASFQLHIPVVDQYITRASWELTEKQVKISAGPYVEKPMLHDIKSNKPFLLLTYDRDSLNSDEKYLLQAADYIGHFQRYHAYAFYPDRQIANDKRNTDSVNKILPSMYAPDSCIVNAGSWYVNHFDNYRASSSLFGSGALVRSPANNNIIATIPIVPTADRQEYEFSTWFLLSAKDFRSPIVILESLDESGNVIGAANMDTKYSVDNHNLWFRGSVYFRVAGNCRAVRCRLANPDAPCYEVMDEMMLRPTGSLIVSKAPDGSAMVNNHILKTFTTK